jgi:hypothetical protein
MATKRTKIEKAMSKGETLEDLADRTELSRKDVGRVLDELAVLIEQHVGKRSVGTFTLPALLKIKIVQRPARRARRGVPNPFRPGETMDVVAKPRQPVCDIEQRAEREIIVVGEALTPFTPQLRYAHVLSGP